MKKVIVWGNRIEYDFYYKYFETECLKLNMEIKAVILNEEGMFSTVDGIEVIKIDELVAWRYDYLIDMNQGERELVQNILKLLNIPPEKVILARVFKLPSFDLDRYIKVRESRVSIIANQCWGGFTYHSLGMQFLSSFINLYVMSEDYIKLLRNFDYYMDLPLHFIREEYEPNLERNYPVLGLDDVTLHFNHYRDSDSAIDSWNRRKSRINRNNMFVCMTLSCHKHTEEIQTVPLQHKHGLTAIPYGGGAEDICFLPMPGKDYLEKYYERSMGLFINHVAEIPGNEFKYYDILKLLCNEKDFMRVKF